VWIDLCVVLQSVLRNPRGTKYNNSPGVAYSWLNTPGNYCALSGGSSVGHPDEYR
jgi:hypothetical protein